METAAAQSIPTRLIEALFDSDRDGRPVLPVWGRDEAYAWLRRVIVDFDSLEGHLSLLQELYQEKFRYDRPGPLVEGAYRLPLGEGPSRFKRRDPLPDDRIVAVADDGPDALADDELAETLLNPVALIDLYRAIDELSPEAWQLAWHEAGKELFSGDATVPKSSEIILPLTTRKPTRRLIGVARVSALAASLLLGITIGARAFRDQGGVSPRGDWSAAGTFLVRGTRGVNESNRIKIQANLDGFATIVSLFPGERPEVTPGVGGELIRVKLGSSVESPPLPPDSNKATVALIVVTVTPSDADIRRALKGRMFLAGEFDQLRSFLDARLRELNHRDIAFTRVAVPPVSN